MLGVFHRLPMGCGRGWWASPLTCPKYHWKNWGLWTPKGHLRPSLRHSFTDEWLHQIFEEPGTWKNLGLNCSLPGSFGMDFCRVGSIQNPFNSNLELEWCRFLVKSRHWLKSWEGWSKYNGILSRPNMFHFRKKIRFARNKSPAFTDSNWEILLEVFSYCSSWVHFLNSVRH